jgi:hypothetical protein
MADITENEVRTYIATELATATEIPALKHRAVENKIMDFIVQETAKAVKTKVLFLDIWTNSKNYSLSTGFTGTEIIESMQVFLVCKEANNGFAVGDVVTAPTPYPGDTGRTAAQGIGLQYNQAANNAIKIITNSQITIMSAYNSNPGAGVGNVILSNAITSKWKLKLIIGYK